MLWHRCLELVEFIDLHNTLERLRVLREHERRDVIVGNQILLFGALESRLQTCKLAADRRTVLQAHAHHSDHGYKNLSVRIQVVRAVKGLFDATVRSLAEAY